MSDTDQPVELALPEQPVRDITIQAHKLARALDRLPDGEYHIVIVKRGRTQPWQAQFVETVVIKTLDLFR